ncbi:hypothetical protein Q5752_000187 [Cryptotrichosporon argae]
MSVISLPQRGDACSTYRPSSAAHTDFLAASGQARTATRLVQIAGPSTPRFSGPAAAGTIGSSVKALLSGSATQMSYHAISDLVRLAVKHGLGPAIEAAYKTALQDVLTGYVREWKGGIMAREQGWLSRLLGDWQTIERRVQLVASVLVHLEAVHLRSSGSLYEIALSLFRTVAWSEVVVREKTESEIAAWAAAEREADIPDTAQRTTVEAMFALAAKLLVSDTLFATYLASLEAHCQVAAQAKQAAIAAGSLSAVKYVLWTLTVLQEEDARAAVMGDEAQRVAAAGLVVEHCGRAAGDVIRQALIEALDAADTLALRATFNLADLTGRLDIFVDALGKHIETRLRTLLADPSKDAQMIEGILALKRFVDPAVAELFATSAYGDVGRRGGLSKPADQAQQVRIELEDAVRNGFKAGMGSRQNAPAEWLAKHLDSVMRRGQGSGTEAEFSKQLDEIIALVGFTKDKDVFKAFYSNGLAKRLLLGRSASDDMERNMIMKLQLEMGDEFTSGDIMMKDLQLSETLVKAYQSARARNPQDFKDVSNLTANVLTESAWPAYPQLTKGWSFTLTPDLQASVDAFTAWYATQHKNRKLSWRHQLGSVTLAARFDTGRYEVGVSLFQAVVLLQFNEADVLGFEEIRKLTGIESSELVRTLQSLALGRKGTRVLLKKPAGKEVEPTDKFAFNKAFTSDRIKFRINQIQQDLSAEESRQTNEQVAVDRVSVLEATIVRIMKGRKTLTLQLLIDGVVTDVSKRFPPDVKEIKKRVESLIEREFLMRDEDDRNVLHYVA